MKLSTVEKAQCIELLESYMQAAISCEQSLEHHFNEGATVDPEQEGYVRDYLNECVGLSADEYQQLKGIFIEYWEASDTVISSESSSAAFQHLVELCESNCSALLSLTCCTRELISDLANCQMESNDAEEVGELTGDEASDRFSDLLASYGLDYFLYGELHEMEWVEAD